MMQPVSLNSITLSFGSVERILKFVYCVCIFVLCLCVCIVFVFLYCVCIFVLCLYICIVFVFLYCVCIYILSIHRPGFTDRLYRLQPVGPQFGRPTKITLKKNIWTISKFPETSFFPNSILALNYNSFCSSLRVGLVDPSDGDLGAGRNGQEFRCLCPTHFRN